MHTCKNCQHSFEGNYCTNCGQHFDTKRITWTELVHHLHHAIFHVDNGLFYSIGELTRRPGHSLREYLEGKRIHHFNPFLMVLLIGGVCSILYAWFHFRMISSSFRLDDLDKAYPFIAHKYYAIVVIVCCLWMSVGDYIIFRKWKYTFPEFLVFNVFICAQMLVLLLIFIPVFLLGRQLAINDILRVLFLVLVLVYCCWARIQFFNVNNQSSLIFRILASVISYILFLYFLIHILIGSFFK